MFTNDLFPRATKKNGSPQTETDWKLIETYVKKGASIGSNADTCVVSLLVKML